MTRLWLEQVPEPSICLDDTCFGVFVKQGMKLVKFRQMCLYEESVRVYGNTNESGGIVHQDASEERCFG